ncbi:DMT family transporter [Acidaminobacter hydrogenoformans]|uniref:Permease of the drug/metabolite transporter (DMT) superfamily n=1 Tax=Acidaminobacter hydrogenoformans DSM 2784 TaxID=1120920 RepID=A0A1G5S6J7_9FIRM|nr:DMT family transporter [Acidaminobacter hydrogenoformans]SCZ82002.1 Permease of the drug/metabolite transporter (DMT) superfamily [Acidaminobacter hydrogenoformans DSM 2784]
MAAEDNRRELDPIDKSTVKSLKETIDPSDEYPKKTRLLAGLGLMTTALMWGSTFPAGKYALEFMSPFYLMGFRFLFAFVLMAVIFRKKLFSTKLKDMKGGLIAGVMLSMGYVLQIYGLQFTTASKQSFLAGAYVVAVPFLTWAVFKKNPSIKAYIGAAVCFWGIGMISLNENLSIGLGDSITLLSSMFYAAHIVVTGYFAHREDAGVFTAVQFGVGAVMAMVLGLVFSPAPQVFHLGMLAVLYLAVFGSIVAYYLQTVCQKYLKPSVTSIILSMEAVFGSLLSVVLLGDAFTTKMAIGAAAMLAAIWISEA